MSNDELAQRVLDLYTEKKFELVLVESCTGGALVNILTNQPGSSEVIKRAFITYSNEAKIALGVPDFFIRWHSVYSPQMAGAMAQAGRAQAFKQNRSRAVCGVGITGSLTRVDPANPKDSIPGHVFVGYAFPNETIGECIEVPDFETRSMGKEYVVREVLEGLLMHKDFL